MRHFEPPDSGSPTDRRENFPDSQTLNDGLIIHRRASDRGVREEQKDQDRTYLGRPREMDLILLTDTEGVFNAPGN